MENKKKQHGGFREGSGRKNLGRNKSMSFKASKEEIMKIHKAKSDLSLVDFILSKIKEEE
ncbi:MAG: hypothetical protein ACRCX2_27565 [Paraclostridium sp.]